MEKLEKLTAIAKFMTEDCAYTTYVVVEERCTIGWPLVKAWHHDFITTEGITSDGWSYISFTFQTCLELGMEA